MDLYRPLGFKRLNITTLNLENGKGEVKFSPVHAMKAYRGSRVIAPLIFNLGERWMWVVFVPRPLQSREITPKALNRWLSGPPEPARKFRRTISSPYRDSNPGALST